MTKLVFCAAEPAHPHDSDLSVSRRKRRFGKHVVSKHNPALQKMRMPGERSEDVVDLSISPQTFHHISGFIVPFSFGERRNTRCGQRHGSSPSKRFREN